MPKCLCGEEIHNLPYEHWEECPNCERRLAEIEYERRRETYVTQLESWIRRLQGALTGPVIELIKENTVFQDRVDKLQEYIIEEVGIEHVPIEFGGELE